MTVTDELQAEILRRVRNGLNRRLDLNDLARKHGDALGEAINALKCSNELAEYSRHNGETAYKLPYAAAPGRHRGSPPVREPRRKPAQSQPAPEGDEWIATWQVMEITGLRQQYVSILCHNGTFTSKLEHGRGGQRYCLRSSVLAWKKAQGNRPFSLRKPSALQQRITQLIADFDAGKVTPDVLVDRLRKECRL